MIYKSIAMIDKLYDPVNKHSQPQFSFKYPPMKKWKDAKLNCTCQCCGTTRSLYWFPEVPDSTWGYTQDGNVRPGVNEPIARGLYCIPCLNEIFDLFQKQPTMDRYKALFRICMMLNVYYDDQLAHDVYNDKNRRFPNGQSVDSRLGYVDLYLRAVQVNPALKSKTFFYSDNLIFDAVVEKQCDPEQEEQRKTMIINMKNEIEQLREEKRQKLWENENVIEKAKEDKQKNDNVEEKPTQIVEKKPFLTQQEQDEQAQFLSAPSREARTQVLQIFHKDPFANESIEDRETMYVDLATMIDDAMTDDLLRQKSAIEVVRIFTRIDKLSEAIRALQESPQTIIDSAAQLKSLSDQKAKELSSVTQLAKDHGFAERYALSKAKGSGTLSAIIREASENDFDPCAINKYDIETSEAIKQVSDISAKSIMQQLQLTESEYSQMINEQAQVIRKQQEDLAKIKEELRVVRASITKDIVIKDLEKELTRKKMPASEIDAIVKGCWQ